MELIKKAIVAVFRDVDAKTLTGETKLGSIPGWDSMTAVNLLFEIEELSGHQNLQFEFSNDLTLSQLLDGLRAQGVKV